MKLTDYTDIGEVVAALTSRGEGRRDLQALIEIAEVVRDAGAEGADFEEAMCSIAGILEHLVYGAPEGGEVPDPYVVVSQATYDHLIDTLENPPEPSARLKALLRLGAGGCCPHPSGGPPDAVPEKLPEPLERYGRGYSSGVGPLLWGKIKIPLVLEEMLFEGVIQRGLSVVVGASPLPAGLEARLGELGIQVHEPRPSQIGADVVLVFDTSYEEVTLVLEVLKPGGWMVGSVKLPERLEDVMGVLGWTGIRCHLDGDFEYFSMRKR